MSRESHYHELEESEWIQVPGTNYIIKYKFMENGYTLIISNLSDIFGEHLSEIEVQRRFSVINPYVEMKGKVIVKNLKLALENILNDKESNIKVKLSDRILHIPLEFSVNQVSFIFNLEPVILSNEKLQAQIIAPTISHALFLHQENLALKKKVSELESKFNSSVPSEKPLLDFKSNLKAFTLFNKNSVLETEVIDAFLEMQNSMKQSFPDRKKLAELHSKHLSQIFSSQQLSKPAVLSVKRELSEEIELKSEIKYEETAERNIERTNGQSTSAISCDVKVKKKKTLKF